MWQDSLRDYKYSITQFEIYLIYQKNKNWIVGMMASLKQQACVLLELWEIRQERSLRVKMCSNTG